jgi:general secretion pathway protein D
VVDGQADAGRAAVRRAALPWPRAAIPIALLTVLAACHTPSPSPGLLPLQQPSNPQPAPPRVNATLAPSRSHQRPFVSEGRPVEAAAVSASGAIANQAGDITLNFVDTDIREIARTVLGRLLKLNYTIDPSVHGTGSIETATPVSRAALLPLLETVLGQNGATLVERNGIYNVVPTAVGAATNAVTGPGALGAGTEVVPLHYATAADLAKALTPFVSAGGKITPETGRNALIVSGDEPARTALVSLIRAFDTNMLAGQSFAIFPAGDRQAPKLASELEEVLRAEKGGALAGIVRVLPMERVNAVLVISAQPRYIDTARRFVQLATHAEDATARSWHVYYVQNTRAADLQNLLQRAFTPGHVTPLSALPGGTAPGAQQTTVSSGLMSQSGGGAAGAVGGTGGLLGQAGGGTTTVGGLTAGGAGAPGGAGLGAAARTPTSPPPTEALSAETETTGRERVNDIRIIADIGNNALLIYATPAEYDVIDGMLHKVDIVPLQVMIDATIAEVSLTDNLEYGTEFFLKSGKYAATLGTSSSDFPPLSAKPPLTFQGFVLSRPPYVALAALSAVTKVKVLSAPQLMVLDNQPANLLVGDLVPIQTATAVSTIASGAPIVNSIDYRETGVIMKVTPHVNSGGLVTLDVSQEVSDVVPSPAPAGETPPNTPAFSDRLIQTRVAVQDGQTVGMAGLIKDSDSQGNSGLPIIKDIPILGTLASTQANSRVRTELLVLITPHVVHDQRDARALTEDMRNELINAGLVPPELQQKPASGKANPNGY